MELESGDETKIPTVAEARARFDQAEGVPPHKVSRSEIEPAGLPRAKVQPKPREPAAPVPEYTPKKVEAPGQKPEKTTEKPYTKQEEKKSPSPRSLMKMFKIGSLVLGIL